jgi:tripartite-type tricarboxylate transporter receptor subunit TctC
MKMIHKVMIGLMAILPIGVQAESTYPTKPIKLIVGFAPGGSADINARMTAAKLAEIFGQPVVVENKAGASGMIAVQAVARSAPDGYTLLLQSSGPQVITPHLVDTPVNPMTALDPVARIGNIALVVLSNTNSGVKSFDDLVKLAGQKPGDVVFGSPGVGTTHQLVMELAQQKSNTRMTHAGYKGSAPGLQDLAAGNISYMVDTVSTAKPFIDSGRVMPLAVTSAARSDVLPDTPSLAELGYPGIDASLWLGIFVPHGTPEPVQQRLNAAINLALDPQKYDLRQRLAATGWTRGGGTAADFRKEIEAESKQWKSVIDAAGVQVK